jgi:hypothetical protein
MDVPTGWGSVALLVPWLLVHVLEFPSAHQSGGWWAAHLESELVPRWARTLECAKELRTACLSLAAAWSEFQLEKASVLSLAPPSDLTSDLGSAHALVKRSAWLWEAPLV